MITSQPNTLAYERLSGAFKDFFGLNVSEGAIMNMFARSRPNFKATAQAAKASLRNARVVASDETGVRVEGANAQHWVFHCKDAVLFTSPIAPVLHGSFTRPWAAMSARYGYLIGIQPSNLTAIDIKPALHIWRVIQPLRWSMVWMICLFAFGFGSGVCLISSEP